jgi:hypothetical protein
MSKDSTEVKTAGPNTRLWLADAGATEPADYSVDFSDEWDDMGFLSDPPAPTPNDSQTDIEAWNADDPVRSLLTTTWSVDLKLMQSNKATFELYFGPLTFTTEGDGVSIEPDDTGALADKVICLELVDGADVLRIYWRRTTVTQHGAISMDKAAAIIYEVTLTRLTPDDDVKSWRIQTNVASLLSA